MKKETMYILGGVAVVGLAYYLFKKPTTTPSNSSSFSNLTGNEGRCCGGGSACPPGYTCTTVSADGGKTFPCFCIKEVTVKY